MLKYSFVLPAYKARFFREALDSILAQTYKDFELIIVNDASPEDLDSIVKSYDDPRIRYYVNEHNIGGKDLVAQWNHCLEYAEGDYIILASDDDVYFPQYLEKMDALVQKYPEVNVFRPRVQRINEKGEIFEIESILPEYSSLLEFAYARHCNYIKSGIPFYIMKKSTLLAMGGYVNYPLAWYADDDIVARMSKDGIVSSSEILFSFRHSGENITTKENDSETLMRKLKATQMHYDWYEKYIDGSTALDKYQFFYKRIILAAIPRNKQGAAFAWIDDSTFSAILSNCLKLLINKIIPLRKLIRILISKI